MGFDSEIPPSPLLAFQEAPHLVDRDPGSLSPTREGSTINPSQTRAPPCHPTRIAFFERHLIFIFVQKLLPTCHIEGCSLPPKWSTLKSIINCGPFT